MIEPNVGMDPTLPARTQPQADPPAAGHKDFKLFGEKGFSFFDLLDVINPLQHIPIISTIYRKLTGDELSPGARIAGATLFGGPIGAAIAMVDTAVEHNTGRDMGATAMAALTGDDGADPKRNGNAPILAAAESPVFGFAGGGSAGRADQATFVAAAVPDLGALSTFVADAAPGSPIQLDPRFAVESWQPPAKTVSAVNTDIAQTAAVTAAVPGGAAHSASQSAQSALAEAQAARAAQMALSTGDKALSDLSAGLPGGTDYDAATAVDLNVAARRIKPYASDIPHGAAATLSRNAMRAYARSMANAPAANSSTADNAVATVSKLEQSTAAAQNDWVIDAMARAMAKYEASHRLQSAGSQPMLAVSR